MTITTATARCPACAAEAHEILIDGIATWRCERCGSVWRDRQRAGMADTAQPAWSERINHAMLALGDARCARLAARVREQGLARGIWIERDGRREGIALSLRPGLMDLACRGYLHHVAWQLRMGLRHVVRLTARDPLAAAAMPMEPAEREWVDRYRLLDPRYASARGERIFCRLDALGSLEGPGWRDRLKFVEANVVGIGGMSYTPPAEQLMLDLLLGEALPPDTDMEFDLNPDPRALLMDELRDHARVLGNQDAPVVAFVDDCSLYTLGGELGRLVPWFRGQGLDALYCDVRDLDVDAQGRVVAAGRVVDVVYRFVEIRDLAGMESRGDDLRGMRAAFARGRVVPSAGGDLEHKSCFELLTDPVHSTAFDAELRAVARDHVLWTRLLRERTTTGPDGAVIDLAEFALQQRESLVVKPNRSAGGEGVVLGARTTPGAWHDALEQALRVPDTCVVQEAAPLVPEPFPVLDAAGRVGIEPRYCALGLFPSRRGLAVFGRYSTDSVVNINSGGGIAPYLVSVR